MQLSKKTQRQASIAAISGLVIIGAASLFFKTYPHLNPFSCKAVTNDEKKKDEKKNDEKKSDGKNDEENAEKSDVETEAIEEVVESPTSAESEEFSAVNADDAN